MNENQQNNNDKKEHCENCNVSEETIQKLKESANKKPEYISKREQTEKERLSKIRWQKNKKVIYLAAAVIILAGLAYAGAKYIPLKSQSGPKITVYLSPTCSCCRDYITYLRSKGFTVEAKETNDMISIKEKYNIPENAQACHTSVIGDYVIEGHAPIQAIEKLLAEKPKIDGIALPGMPQGAPGMAGFKGSTFRVYGLKDGVSSEFGEW